MNKSERSELFGVAASSKQKSKTRPSVNSTELKGDSRSSSRAGHHSAVNSAYGSTQITEEKKRSLLKEAAQQKSTAESYITKTWKNWTCDYFSAAPYFEKAASLYKSSCEDDLAIKMFIEAANCYAKTDSHPLSAKNYQEAGQIAARLGNEEEASDLNHSAALQWLEGGEEGKAGEYLGKSAAILEKIDCARAAAEYRLAVDTMVPPGCDVRTTDFVKVIGSKDVIERCITFSIDNRKFPESIYAINRYYIFLNAEKSYQTLYRMFLTETIVRLAMNDHVAANDAFIHVHLQNDGYLVAPECKVDEDLLTSFKEYDSDLLESIKADQTLLRLDSSAVKLLRSFSFGTQAMQKAPRSVSTKDYDGATIDDNETNDDIVDLGLDELVITDDGNEENVDLDALLERARKECNYGKTRAAEDDSVDLT